MPCIETVVAVLFLDTSFRLNGWKLRCHDFSALQTSLQTQKGHALTQSLKGTGYGLDNSCTCYGRWLVMRALLTEALHGASSKVGRHCWIVYCFWGRFTWRFSSFSPGRTLKQCRTHQSWSNVQIVDTVRFWRFLPGVHGDLADLG